MTSCSYSFLLSDQCLFAAGHRRFGIHDDEPVLRDLKKICTYEGMGIGEGVQ